jgi:hypothetical protein
LAALAILEEAIKDLGLSQLLANLGLKVSDQRKLAGSEGLEELVGIGHGFFLWYAFSMARLPSKRKGLSHFVTRAGSVVRMYYSDLGNLQVAQSVGLAHDRGNPQDAVLT